MNKLPVAILGATGAVGQRFIQLLLNHPWFEVAEVIGSERTAGRVYGEAAHWVLDGEIPESVRHMRVKPLDETFDSPLVFSALPKEAADPREMERAASGHVVCSNAATNRMIEDVPLLLPEVNADHVRLVDVQRARRGWTTGALITNSNCTAMPGVMALAPLRQFGIERVSIVSMQAISGAGYPGVSALDILDNVIPYIGGEEDKVETETRRMLGALDGEVIEWLDAQVGASCNRVPIVDGHMVNVAVSLRDKPSFDDIIAAWDGFRGPDPVPSLPSAPEYPVAYLRQPDRPQVRRDRAAGNGMTTSIGRLRADSVLGYKFATLSHNTVRGAAGCSILNAELLAVQGYVHGYQPEIQPVLAEV